jgi:ketosteroid isomerase-like protein
MGTGATIEPVKAWLAEMQDCVQTVDFARCRAIFAPDVTAFGSLGERLSGLERLEHDQWRRVWPRISNFTFDLDRLDWGGTGDVLWLACPWTSEGRREDGTPFTRPGRITAVLERRAGRWVAVHTHHSLTTR